jgi:catechol 2,3-dioxygenase-like lactoylglutathione lyase family enzyme
MLDHVILTVSNVERSLAFYEAALKPLNIRFFMPYKGENGHPDLFPNTELSIFGLCAAAVTPVFGSIMLERLRAGSNKETSHLECLRPCRPDRRSFIIPVLWQP